MPQDNEKMSDNHDLLIALGGNVGLTWEHSREVLHLSTGSIAKRIGTIVQKSADYRTPAFPIGSGADFANAVIRVRSSLGAKEALSELHQIEAELGRVRTTRWGARTIDLDLLAVDDQVLPDLATWREWADLAPAQQARTAPDQLILPHPRIQDRAFVLVPLAEVAPDWRHPVTGKSALEMRDALPPGDLRAVVAVPQA